MAYRQKQSPMIDSLDHLVLTVRDIDATLRFYAGALGMQTIRFTAKDGSERVALGFGRQKINLHCHGREFEPKAERPLPGSADLCFLTKTPVQDVAARLAAAGIAVIEGPVQRTGATGPILSIYIRDPDGNLIEISNSQA
jgi:catechol 2,3-dioxygenase-like lactoylglutathione lyase family enzyme